MAIDRSEDDSSPTAIGPDEIREREIEAGDYSTEGIDVEKIAAPDGNHDPGSRIVDGQDRTAYHLRHREVVQAEFLAAARERWNAAKPALETEWREYARAHPAVADVSAALDEAAITKVKKGCDRIAEAEDSIVTPAMLRIEAADPERHLVGLEHRRKGQDRIMDKVAAALEEQSDLTPEEALVSVKDAIRYTLQYAEERYSGGVHADFDRLKGEGYELVDIRNSWASEEYKGVNSRWRVPENGQLFEVQFHTDISFEAKQLTHEAYERVRRASATSSEQDELAHFQQRVNSYIPYPPCVLDIPNFP
jgi:hypothetical protein